MHINDTIYNLIGSDNTSIALDGLIPGTCYSITVRAYQDILGPPKTNITATTDDGKECIHVTISFINNKHVL